MTSTKVFLLDQIKSMDNEQAERFLRFTRPILNHRIMSPSSRRESTKERAIREIRAALANQGKLNFNW